MSNIPDHVSVVTPELIAGQLAEVSRIIWAADELTEEDKQGIADRLRAAANNVKIMNSLEFTDGHFIPKNAGEMWYLVDLIVKAKAAPSSYENNPATIFLGVQKALELGVDPLTGLSNIMVVNNRLSVWGDLAQALIQRSGQLERQTAEKIGDWPDEGEGLVELAQWPLSAGWRVTTWRKGNDEPFVGEFTVADAKRANLWMNTRKQPWITDPTRMLFNRARARSQRDGFADGLFGMAIAEEQQDISAHAPNVTHPALTGPASVDDDDEPVTRLAPPPPMTDFSQGIPIPEAEKTPVQEPPADNQGD
ncbi:hypothetical protein [Sphingobium yanoikuyae]|uniref:hypothetical protein n=1 Tax=Sphingobium yanoikuyae TaxID=13690 RepID=UPI0035C7680B